VLLGIAKQDKFAAEFSLARINAIVFPDGENACRGERK
jgi:hypothetical protein